MPSITDEQIAAAYSIGLRRLRNEISESDAIILLADRWAMNRSSANDYVDALRHMVNAETFKRTIKVGAASHYLSGILRDLGVPAARNAVKSLNAHIEYYEGVTGSRCKALRSVSADFDELLETTTEEIDRDFDAEVFALMAQTPAARARSLPPIGHKPLRVKTEILAFIRNAAVVAEVLLRAAGACEHCKGSAPFKRAKNGEPYLEIHHKIRLADGGDDTVANAIAVCPNCHRKLHYG